MRSDSLPWCRVGGSQGADAASELVSALSAHGLVLLDGVSGPDDLLHLTRSIATIVPHRDGDAAGLTTIADVGGQMRSGFAGFSACALNPHTDRSGVANPPILLMMSCGQPASSGGECVVIDAKAVYDDLTEDNAKALQALSSPRSVLFGGQGYVLDNCRWLHGRRAFSGQRVMYRVNGNPRPELG